MLEVFARASGYGNAGKFCEVKSRVMEELRKRGVTFDSAEKANQILPIVVHRDLTLRQNPKSDREFVEEVVQGSIRQKNCRED